MTLRDILAVVNASMDTLDNVCVTDFVDAAGNLVPDPPSDDPLVTLVVNELNAGDDPAALPGDRYLAASEAIGLWAETLARVAVALDRAATSDPVLAAVLAGLAAAGINHELTPGELTAAVGMHADTPTDKLEQKFAAFTAKLEADLTAGRHPYDPDDYYRVIMYRIALAARKATP